MSTVRKTITLTSNQSEWVKSRIASGDFTNDSEYIRDLIRRDQERQRKIEKLQAALDEGLNSGVATALDMEAIKQKARQEASKRESQETNHQASKG